MTLGRRTSGAMRAFLLAWVLCGFKAHGADYFVDFTSGSDGNDGLSAASPFSHCPGDPNASGRALAVRPAPGDVFFFKRGVVYHGQINCLRPGRLVAEGAHGSITRDGVLADANTDFAAGKVSAGDYVYIFNRSLTGAWLESCGVWPVNAVSTASLTLGGFDGLAYSGGDLAWQIHRPVSYTSTNGWGSGDAIISGDRARDYHFRLQDYSRFAGLRLVDLRDIPGAGCDLMSEGSIWDKTEHSGLIIDGVVFSNVWSGVRCDALNFPVIRNCTVDGFGFIGLEGGRFSLIENNHLTNGTSGIRGCGQFSVIRHNTLIDCNHPAASACGYHADGIGPFFSPGAAPGSNEYGWIYGNFICNTVEGIFLEYNNRGTTHWTIFSNVLIGRRGAGGSGDAAIIVNSAPDTRIYNNVIFGLDGCGGWVNGVLIAERERQGPSARVEVKNNIFYSLDSTAPGITVDAVSRISMISEGNFFFTPNRTKVFGVAGVLAAFSTWQAGGYDAGGASRWQVDPLFVNVAGKNPLQLDFHLRSDSPARSSPFSLPVSVKDTGGKLRIAGTSWDRGAYQTSP